MGKLSEEGSDRFEDFGVGANVGADGVTNRVLVDADEALEVRNS